MVEKDSVLTDIPMDNIKSRGELWKQCGKTNEHCQQIADCMTVQNFKHLNSLHQAPIKTNKATT